MCSSDLLHTQLFALVARSGAKTRGYVLYEVLNLGAKLQKTSTITSIITIRGAKLQETVVPLPVNNPDRGPDRHPGGGSKSCCCIPPANPPPHQVAPLPINAYNRRLFNRRSIINPSDTPGEQLVGGNKTHINIILIKC